MNVIKNFKSTLALVFRRQLLDESVRNIPQEFLDFTRGRERSAQLIKSSPVTTDGLLCLYTLTEHPKQS